jgi:hypothetical protein
MKPDQTITDEESTLIIRWSTLSFIQELIDEDTVFFDKHEEVSSETKKQAGSLIQTWLLNSLEFAKRNIEKYQLSEEQIQNAIIAREEKERNFFINKFDVLDDDLRKIEKMKEKLKLGDWNVSSKNLFSYNRDWWEREREQRAAMGILPEYGTNVSGAIQEEQMPAQEETRVEDSNDHRAAQDEDES